MHLCKMGQVLGDQKIKDTKLRNPKNCLTISSIRKLKNYYVFPELFRTVNVCLQGNSCKEFGRCRLSFFCAEG